MTGSIAKILITVSFALLAFALAYIISAAVLANRIAAEKRLDDLNKREGDVDVALVKNESRQTRRKKERKKQKTDMSEKFGNVIYKELQSADIKMRPEEFLIIWIVLTFIPGSLVVLFVGSIPISIALIVVGLVGPIVYIKNKQKSRVKKFEDQLSDALMICCSCLRSGLSFNQAIETIAKDMDAPISTEFATVVRELNLGYSMEEAMENLRVRIKSKHVELMVSAVLVQRQTGGNLSQILENISNTIKENMKLKKQFKTQIASGKTSGLIVGAMPVILLVMFSVLNYDYVRVLFEETRGNFVLIAAAALELLAFLMIKKMTTLKI